MSGGIRPRAARSALLFCAPVIDDSLPPGRDGVLELFSRLLQVQGTGEALDTLVQGTIDLLQAEAGYLVREVNGRLLFFKSWGGRPDGTTEAVSSTIVAEALASEGPLLVPDATVDPKYAGADSVIKKGIKSVLAAPVDAGQLVALYVESGQRAMGEEELALFRLIVEMANTVLVENAKRLVEEHQPELFDEYDLEGIVAQDALMVEVLDRSMRMARVDFPVLVQGPNGSGKEKVAEAIHRNSSRKKGPFVPVNCGAIDKNLFGAQVFGHLKGAFSGAHQSNPGYVRQAHRGTLFLDEIGELPPDVQASLLRVLQDQEVTPLGSPVPVKVDVRFIAATNLDLRAAKDAGRFREDLYFRVARLNVAVPPLRERPDDVLPLFRHFVEHHSREQRLRAPTLTQEGERLLQAYSWPGNVRELENEVLQLLTLYDGREVGPEHLSRELRAESEAPKKKLSEAERETVVEHLEATGWNQSRAARSLGISREGLRLKMKRHGIERPR